ncbi:MAG: crossover junction endodeoxyribonuclease RuvC [Vampirovibrionales bacterium]|nr:crossover junction endodeoxyribonuclease RuvC [Vampirovibrionales bacterium]
MAKRSADYLIVDAPQPLLVAGPKPLKILGIDPGLGRVGFGLMEWQNSRHRSVSKGPALLEWHVPHWGLMTTDKTQPDHNRLKELYTDFYQLVADLSPDVLAIEKLFFFKNITTAMPVSQARGVLLLVAAQYNLPVFEYTPMQVKQTLTGYGKAQKREVQETLVQVLGLEKKPTPDDAADAIALAYCYTQMDGKRAMP